MTDVLIRVKAPNPSRCRFRAASNSSDCPENIEEVYVLAEVLVGFPFRYHGLPQEIDREGDSLGTEFLQPGKASLAPDLTMNCPAIFLIAMATGRAKIAAARKSGGTDLMILQYRWDIHAGRSRAFPGIPESAGIDAEVFRQGNTSMNRNTFALKDSSARHNSNSLLIQKSLLNTECGASSIKS